MFRDSVVYIGRLCLKQREPETNDLGLNRGFFLPVLHFHFINFTMNSRAVKLLRSFVALLKY